MEGIKTVIYPVRDRDQAKQVFEALLGVTPYADEPYYVGYKVADQDIGLDPNGHAAGMTGPVPYFHVSDVRAALQRLLDAGAVLNQDARDVGGGTLIASVTDADGNAIGLRQVP